MEQADTRDRSVEEVVLLARLCGLHLPSDDLVPLAAALVAHRAFVEPLLQADPDDLNPALTHDPRWRD